MADSGICAETLVTYSVEMMNIYGMISVTTLNEDERWEYEPGMTDELYDDEYDTDDIVHIGAIPFDVLISLIGYL